MLKIDCSKDILIREFHFYYAINLSMFKQDNYDQIFSHRMTNQSIQIIKKFFVFQPSNQTSIKPYSSLMSKIKQPGSTASKKHNPKFPGGFQQCTRPVVSHEQQQQPIESSSIVLKSKRIASNEISSFLLGLTGRINRQIQPKLAQIEAKKTNEISPDKKVSYEQVMANLNKIRRDNRTKYASIMPTSNTSNSQSISNQSELPLLQKRTSSPDRRNSSSIASSLTPIFHNKSSTPVCRSNNPQQDKEKEKERKINIQSNRAISVSFSSKIIKPVQQQTFAKGYLFYDTPAKDLMLNNQQNMSMEPQIKKNLNNLSAKNYIVINRQNLKIIAQKNSQQQIEIASLTKIMTCYLTLLVCKKYKVDPKDTLVRVSERSQEMPGTSAELQAGDIVSLKDLLYALMLPSGNDASVAIAQTVGKIIQKNKKKPSKKTYYQTFIFHMNLLSKQLQIQQNFQNTSGLSFNPNFSSPKAITILTAAAMKNPQFYQIINCKEFQLQIRNERYGLVRKQLWKNTNKLLWKGWEGVKTGTTQSAGHCLMSCKGEFIISVFNCETLNKRFTECLKIYQQVTNLTRPLNMVQSYTKTQQLN